MADESKKAESKTHSSPAKVAVKKPGKKPFALDSPFADPKWPVLSTEQCDTIMELLCRLLEPIGTHRVAWVKPSKGKRERKRKRSEQKSATQAASGTLEAERSMQPPTPPEISQHVVTGFNGVVRCLDPASRQLLDQSAASADGKQSDHSNLQILGAIFVDQSTAPELLWSQLPFLVAAAELRDSLHHPRLVPLARGSAARLSEVLGIPRAGIVAIGKDAPESASLLSFVDEHVPSIDIPWLKSMDTHTFQATTIVPHAGPSFRNIAKT